MFSRQIPVPMMPGEAWLARWPKHVCVMHSALLYAAVGSMPLESSSAGTLSM